MHVPRLAAVFLVVLWGCRPPAALVWDSHLSIPTQGRNLNALWIRGDGARGWAPGDDGLLMRFDGRTWTEHYLPDVPLTDWRSIAFDTSGSLGFVAGSEGRMLRYDASSGSWILEPSLGTGSDFAAVWLDPSGVRGYALTVDGRVYAWAERRWTPLRLSRLLADRAMELAVAGETVWIRDIGARVSFYRQVGDELRWVDQLPAYKGYHMWSQPGRVWLSGVDVPALESVGFSLRWDDASSGSGRIDHLPMIVIEAGWMSPDRRRGVLAGYDEDADDRRLYHSVVLLGDTAVLAAIPDSARITGIWMNQSGTKGWAVGHGGLVASISWRASHPEWLKIIAGVLAVIAVIGFAPALKFVRGIGRAWRARGSVLDGNAGAVHGGPLRQGHTVWQSPAEAPGPASTHTPQSQAMPRTAIFVTALPLEFNAVLEHLSNVERRRHPQGTVFDVGIFETAASRWEVAVVESGAGNTSAVLHTERAVQLFNPSHAFFVGVAGGIKDLRVGDVVAATRVYAYESGKVEGERFLPRPDVYSSSYALQQEARAAARGDAWVRRIVAGPEDGGFPPPRALVGPIAAGEKVVASDRAELYRFLRQSYGDAVAVEMEGFGFLRALHANAGVEPLVVRGISDLLEGKTEADRGGSQPVAARRAAAFAFEVLASLDRQPDRSGRDGSERDDAMERIEVLAPSLYELGPTDRNVWARAGGDVSRLRITGRGRDDWFAALRELRNGGGGGRITPGTLVDAMVEDFPNHGELRELRDSREAD